MNPKFNLKIRQELLDFDYIEKLTPEERKFLNTFCEGHYNADFRGKQVKEMFKTKEDRRKCYGMNNARNRCVYSRARASGSVVDNDFELNEDQSILLDPNIEESKDQEKSDSDFIDEINNDLQVDIPEVIED